MDDTKTEATYQQRLDEISCARHDVDTRRDALTAELAQNAVAFTSLQRDPDHLRLYRGFFRVLEARVRESGLPMETALRALLSFPEKGPGATVPAQVPAMSQRQALGEAVACLLRAKALLEGAPRHEGPSVGHSTYARLLGVIDDIQDSYEAAK